MSWTQAARSAKAWLAEPSDAELEAVRKAAQAMNDVVPEAQREAWQKLLRGLARDDDPKRRERIGSRGAWMHNCRRRDTIHGFATQLRLADKPDVRLVLVEVA